MTFETTTAPKRSEIERLPFSEYRRFGSYFATNPVLLGMITLMCILSMAGLIAREYPGLPGMVEILICLVRIGGYFVAVLYFLPPWLYFCVGRNVPLFWAYLLFIFGLILLFHLLVAPFTYSYMGISVSLRVFRQLIFNTATSLTLFLAIGSDVSRALSMPGQPIPIWWVKREPQPEDASLYESQSSEQKSSLTIQGEILSIQAQNQYVAIRVGDKTTLHRMTFKDALEQIPPDDGIKIHRSWWIRKSLIAGIRKDGTNFKVVGHDGLIYPLSKSLVEAVEQVLADHAASVPPQEETEG